MPADPRTEFVERVKTIDPFFRNGDLRAFWPALHALVALAPERRDLSRKKSHYLVSLAARSLELGDMGEAQRFLDYADRHVDPGHLTQYFREERVRWRALVDEANGKGPRRSRRRTP